MIRADLGSTRDPKMAGDPVRLEIDCGSFGLGPITYGTFTMIGDRPVPVPSFLVNNGEVSSGGLVSIQLSSSHTSLWTGRDWHVAKTVFDGVDRSLFEGIVTSTRQLDY